MRVSFFICLALLAIIVEAKFNLTEFSLGFFSIPATGKESDCLKKTLQVVQNAWKDPNNEDVLASLMKQQDLYLECLPIYQALEEKLGNLLNQAPHTVKTIWISNFPIIIELAGLLIDQLSRERYFYAGGILSKLLSSFIVDKSKSLMPFYTPIQKVPLELERFVEEFIPRALISVDQNHLPTDWIVPNVTSC